MSQQVQGRTMHIGEVAERTQLSLRTIRHYDEIGLLPARGRTDGGFRLYTDEDVERLNHVRRIKPLGFTLEEMTELLEMLDAGTLNSEASERAHAYLERARASREKMARKLRQADEFIAGFEAELEH